MDRVWMAHSHKVIDWWRMVRVEKGGPTLHLREFPTTCVGVGMHFQRGQRECEGVWEESGGVCGTHFQMGRDRWMRVLRFQYKEDSKYYVEEEDFQRNAWV
jgi:hypothetical protein